MIRQIPIASTAVRMALGRLRKPRPSPIPYGMFDEAPALGSHHLERIYHKGQEKAWAGKTVLAELVDKHGGVHLPPDKADAVKNLFAVILWGELAAWNISAELAMRIEPLEPKLAATSQAHDEARHFYVMRDYLQLLGYEPTALPPLTARLLEHVLTADNLVKKLLGMQLMVEPTALTFFQVVRERRLEPVLADLLAYFERDEARHVALGVHHLPSLIRGLTLPQAVDVWTWQLRMLEIEFQGMSELEGSFRALGISPREVLRLGQAKQLLACRLMAKELGHDLKVVEAFKKWFDFRIELQWPSDGRSRDLPHRLVHAARETFAHTDLSTSLLTVPET